MLKAAVLEYHLIGKNLAVEVGNCSSILHTRYYATRVTINNLLLAKSILILIERKNKRTLYILCFVFFGWASMSCKIIVRKKFMPTFGHLLCWVL